MRLAPPTRLSTAATAPLPPPPLPQSPLLLTPDGSGLVAEIEAYLATLPSPARTPAPYACPPVCPYGRTLQPWNATHPPSDRPLLDRLLRRPPRPTPVSAADHLRLASRYLTQHGWLQGALWDPAGRVCLLGAQAAVLAHGYGSASTVQTARVQVMEVLHATGRPAASPDEYNDRPGTRQADIHQLLDRAAARAQLLGL
ncbi:hypothetical protein GCM10009665_43460 [Kitasatospora nipponensis]|uniref:Uncharacterized protein n=1 Tax=Kitasatospora nipponensis TaxID=258049 RepID=A0ABN1WEB4_9ACTN